jgi:hypothetical protein
MVTARTCICPVSPTPPAISSCSVAPLEGSPYSQGPQVSGNRWMEIPENLRFSLPLCPLFLTLFLLLASVYDSQMLGTPSACCTQCLVAGSFHIVSRVHRHPNKEAVLCECRADSLLERAAGKLYCRHWDTGPPYTDMKAASQQA